MSQTQELKKFRCQLKGIRASINLLKDILSLIDIEENDDHDRYFLDGVNRSIDLLITLEQNVSQYMERVKQ